LGSQLAFSHSLLSSRCKVKRHAMTEQVHHRLTAPALAIIMSVSIGRSHRRSSAQLLRVSAQV